MSIEQELQEYREEKEKAEEYYKTINKIKCPFLNDFIVFNSEGFNHLIYKDKKERPKNEQIIRFKLTNKATKLLESTHTHQDYYQAIQSIRKKKRKKMVNENTEIKYWGFIAIIDKMRIKSCCQKGWKRQCAFLECYSGMEHKTLSGK